MFSTLKTSALAAIVGLGAFAAAPATAHADGFYLSFGDRGARAGIHVGDSGRSSYHHRPSHFRSHPVGCSRERALWKAENMGLRRVRLEDVSRHSITVKGRSRGDTVWVTFARAPGCPLIG